MTIQGPVDVVFQAALVLNTFASNQMSESHRVNSRQSSLEFFNDLRNSVIKVITLSSNTFINDLLMSQSLICLYSKGCCQTSRSAARLSPCHTCSFDKNVNLSFNICSSLTKQDTLCFSSGDTNDLEYFVDCQMVL